MTKGSIDETLSSLNLYIKHGILQLQDTWEEIGLEREDQAQKCESIVSSLRSVLDSIVIGENAYRECLDEECLELSERCNDSFRLLGMPPFNPGSLTLPLLTRKGFLVKKSEELKEEVAVKTAQIEGLEERKTRCIQRLGLQPDHYPTIQSDNMSRVISLLEVQIKEFEEDMERRSKVLKDQLDELVGLLSALERDKNALIEEGLAGDDVDTLLLSDESIQRRGDMIVKYRNEVQQNITRVLQLRDNITRLHRLLHKDVELDEKTVELFDSPKPSAIEALQKKLRELEEYKQSRLETYVTCLKQEIAAFQGLCFQTTCEVSSSDDISKTSDDRRASLDTLNLPDITVEEIAHSCGDKKLSQWEDNQENRNTLNQTYTLQQQIVKPDKTSDSEAEMVQLEEELDRWESFYNSNSELFEMIRRWNNLNERYTELQQPSPDKYNNRGGALLQAQKESTKIAKELPRIEQKVLTEVEKILGEEIKINGMDLEDYFADNRATTCLSRSSSVRHSKRSSVRTPTRQKRPSNESVKKTPEPSPRNVVRNTPESSPRNGLRQRDQRRDNLKKSEALDRSDKNRKSIRKRTSIDSLDKIGKK